MSGTTSATAGLARPGTGTTGGTTRPGRRLLRVLVALSALVLLWTVATAPPAAAHAGLVSSDPAPGSVLDASPRAVRLRFSEPVAPVAAAFTLYDSSGRHTRDGVLTAVDVSGVDQVVTATVPADLARGSYLLSWRVVSADSHPITGVLSFAVGEVSAVLPAAPEADPASLRSPTTSAFLLLQVLAYLGLFAAVGLRVFEVFVLPRGAAADRVPRRLLGVSAALTLAAYALLVPLTGLRERGGRLPELLALDAWRSSGTGGAVAALGLVTAGSALLLGRYRLQRSLVRPATALGALIALSAVLTTGHTRSFGPGSLSGLADLVHVGAGAVWFGGLLGLALHLRLVHRRQDDPVAAATVVSRFSALAGVLVGLLGLSGLVLAGLVVGPLDGVLDGAYGQALLVKLGLVGVLGLLAVWNKTSLVGAVRRQPGSAAQWRRLRGAVVDEVAVIAVALAVTGLLTMLSPLDRGTDPGAPGGLGAAGPVATASTDLRAELGGGTVHAQLSPGLVGLNTLEFTLRGSDGAPLPGSALPQVSASLPGTALARLPARVERLEGTSRYRAEIALPDSGSWEVVVSVRTSAYDQPSTVLRVTVPA